MDGPGRPRPEFLTIGRVVRAHGVKGALVVLPLTDRPDRFVAGAKVRLGPDGREVTLLSVSPYKGRLLVHFEEIADREGAEAARRCDISIPLEDAGEPDDGGVWAFEIEGLPVVDDDGRDLGRAVAVQSNPAHDLLECVDPAGESYWIPLIEEFVEPITRGAQRLVVHPIPGLLPGEE